MSALQQQQPHPTQWEVRYVAQEKSYTDALTMAAEENAKLKVQLERANERKIKYKNRSRLLRKRGGDGGGKNKEEGEEELDTHKRLCYFAAEEEHKGKPGFESLFKAMPANNNELNQVLVLTQELEIGNLKKELATVKAVAKRQEEELSRLGPIKEILDRALKAEANVAETNLRMMDTLRQTKAEIAAMKAHTDAEYKRINDSRRDVEDAYRKLSDAMESLPEHAFRNYEDYLARTVVNLVQVCRRFPDKPK